MPISKLLILATAITTSNKKIIINPKKDQL